MLFNSHSYILFLMVAVPLSMLTPGRYRYFTLGFFSLLFYGMWRWQFTFLVIFSAAVDYVAAGTIYNSNVPAKRKFYFVLSLVVNIGLLVFFKYLYFIYDNVHLIATALGGTMTDSSDMGLRIILPLGISFYTFQSISYTIDVYRGITRPCKNFALFLSYVTFWPQLIAGPILRENEIIPQLENPPRTSADDITYGIQRIIFGLFKKVVLADNLANIIDPFYNFSIINMNAFPGNDFLIYAILFGFQIYFDFSGYSDIAIGSARLLGISFPENFKWPYMAKSPREFWNRWHISLSSWIRDYLYLPFTGQVSDQKTKSQSTGGISIAFVDRRRTTFALFATWFIMGLWHGAAWTFVMWGVYHATLVFLFRKIKILKTLPEKYPLLSWVITFPAIMAGWAFFRAQSIDQATSALLKIFNPFTYNLPMMPRIYYVLCVSLVALMFMAHWWFEKIRNSERPGVLMRFAAFLMITGMTASILIYFRSINQFIYFQF